MEATYRKFEEWGQFDRYCKLVLYHEAIDYLRELQRLRDNEVSLEVLSPAQWDKLAFMFAPVRGLVFDLFVFQRTRAGSAGRWRYSLSAPPYRTGGVPPFSGLRRLHRWPR